MKKILYIYLIIFHGSLWTVYGQSPCALPTIVTDPSNPINTDNTNLTNNFDWRTQLFTFRNQMPIGMSDQISNFYYVTNNPDLLYLAQKSFSDFQPLDGWELLKRDFGYFHDGTPNSLCANYPYFILYNKYNGVLRVVSSIFNLGAQQAINVKLKFIQPNSSLTNYLNLQKTGLFSTYHTPADPLDLTTTVAEISSMSNYPGPGKNFFYADFQLSYDPCTCLLESALVVEFYTINTLDVQLYGRLIGTSEAISEKDTYGKYQLDQSKDFLTSVYRDGPGDSKAEAGMLIYESIDESVEEMKQRSSTLGFKIGSGLEMLAFGMDVTSKFVADNAIYKVLGQEFSTEKGLEAASMVTEFFAGKLKGEGGESLPNIIHGEMALSGTITDQRAIGASDISFANPGSKNSSFKPEFDSDPNTPDDYTYSFYNQVLGVFGLMNTPQFDYYSYYERRNLSGFHTSDIEDYSKKAWRLNDSIKYMFNPALDIDYSKTTVKGAIVVKSYDRTPNFRHNLDSMYVNDGTTVMISKLLPLDQLSQLTPSVEYYVRRGYLDDPAITGNTKVFLRIVLNIQYKSLNDQGLPNRSAFIITYPINENSTSTDITSIPVKWDYTITPGIYSTNTTPMFEDSLTIGNKNFIYSQVINPGTKGAYTETYGAVQTVYSYKGILIRGNITLGSNVSKVNFISGRDITLDGEASLNGEIELTTNSSKIKPISSPPILDKNLVVAFCNNKNPNYNPYKANVSTSKIATDTYVSTKSDLLNSLNLELNVYPNPVRDIAQINYTVPRGDDVNLIISDLLGRVIYQISRYHSQGNYSINISADNLDEGVYICSIQSGENIITKRISIVK